MEEYTNLPLGTDIHKLRKGGVESMTLKLKVREEVFAVSYKPLDDLVINKIHPMIANNLLSFDSDSDHGQGSMWWTVKYILQYNDNETKTIVKICAEILCKKKSYELL